MENTQRTMLKTGRLHAIRELLYSKVRADFMKKPLGSRHGSFGESGDLTCLEGRVPAGAVGDGEDRRANVWVWLGS